MTERTKRRAGRPTIQLEDTMPENPKILEVGSAAAWILVEAICYCHRNLTDGHVPGRVWDTFGHDLGRKGKRSAILRLKEAGLIIEKDDGSLWVHDYLEHQRSSLEIQEQRRKWRLKKQAAPPKVPPGNLGGIPPGISGDSPHTEAEAEAEAIQNSSSAREGDAAAAVESAACLLDELAQRAGWDAGKTLAARADRERAVAWLRASLSREHVRNPGGWAWAGLSSGAWPSEQRTSPKKRQNGSGQEVDHSMVVDICVACQAEHPLSVLDKGNGFCPDCVTAASSGEAA